MKLRLGYTDHSPEKALGRVWTASTSYYELYGQVRVKVKSRLGGCDLVGRGVRFGRQGVRLGWQWVRLGRQRVQFGRQRGATWSAEGAI